MRLSDLPASLNFTLWRDAGFGNLGFLFDALPEKLVFVESERFVGEVKRARGVSSILTTPELAGCFPEFPGLAVCAAPKRTFFLLQRYLVEETDFYGCDSPSEIHAGARVHPRAWVAAQNVRIGAGTVVGPNVAIGERCQIGSRVRILAGSVIGGEGFQTAREGDAMVQMAHAGWVRIEDDVEIFANVVVANAVFRQATTVGRAARLGNGCFVSHNAQIGARTMIGHNAVVNGNTTVGEDVWIGPNATLSNLVEIGDRARVSLGATVMESVPAGGHVSGPAAIPHRRMLRHIASIR